MKISSTQKTRTKSTAKTEKATEKEVPEVKDYRDLDDSLTDWNAEQNQSGRQK